MSSPRPGTSFRTIHSSHELSRQISESPALAVWFSGPDCAVCASLKPKLVQLFSTSFPAIQLAEIDCAESPEAAAAHMVFSVPTLLIFFEGRENLRESRNISLQTLGARLQRSYDLLFQ